jgi:hypothetical protein
VSKTTRPLVRTLEDACCLARAYRWISADPRCTTAVRDVTLRRVKSRLFEVFALPAPVVPANLRFAVEEIYEIVPDKRLLRLANAPA